ncbi:MAG TPA: hypothetical protein VK745_23525, partial [Polyangiaceae bacterium]|nr:hypothetical protein [Polyangiaceae bacterium]
MAFSLASAAANRPLGGARHRLRQARISAAAGLIFLLLALSAAAKNFEIADTGWEGTSEFYAL